MTALPPWPANMGGWTIDSTNMCGPAWRPETLEDLWGPGPNRGSDRVIPGAPGALAKPRRVDARTVAVRFWLTGAVTQAGASNTDPVAGFVANVDVLAGLVAPPALPAVTRTSTLTMPGGGSRTAQIIVESFDYQREASFGALVRAALTITIPAGAHT